MKDDLIVKVDELISEQEMLRDEIRSLNVTRERLKMRVTELEDEIRKLKDANDSAKQAAAAASNNNDPSDNLEESDVPMAQRKRFTRMEMARVLMERNQYKVRPIYV